MSWPYWLVGAVIVLLLCLAFRRKRVADQVEYFAWYDIAVAFANAKDVEGFDCFVSRVKGPPLYLCGAGGPEMNWQVRCYRRKEMQE